MTLVRWDPFFRPESWLPAADVIEKGDDLVIRLELPGVDKDAIDVQVEDGELVVRGERKRESEIDEADAYHLERVYGSFQRRFRLPRHVDATKISAAYRDGVLQLRLPRSEEAKSRRIAVQAA